MISIELARATIEAGGVVEGRVVFDRGERGDATTELSILWETSGKGDTDIGVVHFAKIENRGEHRFKVQLPLLPLNYVGRILVIGWFVRVRRGDQTVDEPFTVVAIA